MTFTACHLDDLMLESTDHGHPEDVNSGFVWYVDRIQIKDAFVCVLGDLIHEKGSHKACKMAA